MKAMIPIGPLVGKAMGQPPNLRELIASADGVTFWASYEKADASSATSRAASKRACGRCSTPKAASRRRGRLADPPPKLRADAT